MWCVPELNAEYIERMEDILELYEQPVSEVEPVVCFDEKPVQLLKDVHPPRTGTDGIRKRDYEYARQGTANIFVVIEPKAGRRFSFATRRRTANDFAKALKRIASKYPKARKIRIVMDNLNVHCEKSLIKRFGEYEGRKLWKRFDVHYTPKHASWLNQAEIEISILTRSCLGSRRIADLSALQSIVRQFSSAMNRSARPFNWDFTVDDARELFDYK